MIGTILILSSLVGMLLLGLSAIWPKIRSLLPSSVQTIGDKAEVVVDKATAAAALETLVRLFAERGETATVESLGGLWIKIWAWVPPSQTAIATTTTIEQLAIEIASLKAAAKTADVASTNSVDKV